MGNHGRECGAEMVCCIRWVLAHHLRVPLWFHHPLAPDYVWNGESETTHRIGTANAVGHCGLGRQADEGTDSGFNERAHR